MNLNILIECKNNPNFKSKVYLEMINRYPELNLDFEDFDNLLNESIFKKEQKINTKERIKNNKTRGSIERKEQKINTKERIKNNKTRGSIERKEAKNNSRNNRLISNAETNERIKGIALQGEIERQNMIEDNLRNRRNQRREATINSIKDTGNTIGKTVKNNKKQIAIGGAAVTGTAIAGIAISKIKDKRKFKAWKEINPKKRSKITFDEWVSLGKPLNEQMNAFIEGYYDMLFSI